MTYGIEINNAAGDKVFDEKNVMYEYDTGTLMRVTDLYWLLNTFEAIEANAYGTPYNYDCYQCLSPETGVVQWFDSGTTMYPSTKQNFGDLVFTEIPTGGLLQVLPINNQLPELDTGSTFIIGHRHNAPLVDYKVFSTRFPLGTPSTDYGMQIYDSLGNVVFDSRYRTLGMEVFTLTSSQAQNIINNNATVDFTLSSAKPGAYVSSPLMFVHSSGNFSYTNASVLKVTQPNDTTIRVSREQIGKNLGTVYNTFTYFHDVTLFITRAN